MAHFKSQDFKDMLYPVHTLKRDVDIFKSFPKLKDFEEFGVTLSPTIPITKIFKYIVYAYDQRSPFFTQIEDLRERKILSIKEAGFEPTHQKGFNDSVRMVLNCEHKKVNAMIIRYCRFQGKEFTNLVSSQEAFYQSNLQLLSNIQSKDDDANKVAQEKAKLDELLSKHAERLNEKARKFLSQETAEGLHEDLWKLAEDEAEAIMITPEDYAEIQES